MPNPRTVSINGVVDAIVGTPEECEAATAVVCGPVSYFADDVHTVCASCGAAIVHRPHVPLTPPKICFECMLAMLERKH